MRALITTPVYPPDLGGPATFVPRLAAHLEGRGHDVTVLTFGSRESLPRERWTVVAVPRVFLPLRYLLFFIRCLGMAARADVIFSCEHPRLFSIMAAGLMRRPLVVRVMVDTAWEMAFRTGLTLSDPEDFRHTPQRWRARLLQHLERWELARADRVVAVSEHLASMAVEMGSDPERTVVCKNLPHLPDGVENRDRAEARRLLGVPTDAFHILAVARLVPWKGIDRVLDAVEKLDAGWQLSIAGDGPCTAELAARVHSSGPLSAGVELLGAVDRATTLAYMRASDLLILNSRYEGLSHVLLEAMALGLPAAASDIPGNRELIRDDVGGLLFPPDDVAAMVSAIDRLRASPRDRSRLAEGARIDLGRLEADGPLGRLEDELISAVRGCQRC